VNPDGDALGSNIALSTLLRVLGHDVTQLLAQDKPAPTLYRFLNCYDFIPAASYSGTPSLFIAVDTPTVERLGDAAHLAQDCATVLLIDHHPGPESYANYYCGDQKASATSLLVWKMIEASDVPPSQTMAAAAYVGLMTDTGRFAFQNTSAESFRAAATMVDCGIDPTFLSQEVYENKSLASMQLEARLIERLAFCCEGAVVSSWVTDGDFKELGLLHEDSEGLPSILRSIAGVKVAALLRAEEDGVVRVNLRSTAGTDVGAFARNYGGGGHAAAAGITLHMTLEEARRDFVPALAGLIC
jgi:phosphoesterase RecJ-like protein